MGLACGSARREKMEERGNEWGWFSQMKTTLKRCGVWRNHEKEESLKGKAAEKDQTARETSGNCFGLEESTLLEKIEDVYENKISLRRVYEVKKVISGGKPGREEFNNHVRKLQHLWVELQGLRSHVDGDTTQEQETVLKLLASMESSYGWLVEMVLRGEQLPEMEEICGLIRRVYEIMRDDERLTMSRSESSWKPTGSRSESFQKLTMSRSEGSWRLTGSRSEGFRKKRRCRRLSKASINIGKGRKRVVGECSYSAYMGESVEDSGVLREQEKGRGADDRITRKEWRVEAERTTTLDNERGNGTESHEQVQNQEDSGQHNQEVTQEVESGAQSSGDGQRESTGSDESGTQSSGDWEVDPDGSNESGAQSTRALKSHMVSEPGSSEPELSFRKSTALISAQTKPLKTLPAEGGWRGVMNLKPKLLVQELITSGYKKDEAKRSRFEPYHGQIAFRGLRNQPGSQEVFLVHHPSELKEEDFAHCVEQWRVEKEVVMHHWCEVSLKLTRKLGPILNPSLRRGV
ncbi:hypothetical protein IGI04_042255 [Brassica rapa subsp. trilocularis]|uniref:Uncharacterized protein n=1 Tax=Brassica rapa subsp. trilocularis TaxID=1813537 RepID=A0ABQ7KLV6_BRACM|nr:hypothetical protein IGI04_042255 [Brassica rapa subsp. trilocularis]